MRRSFIFRQVYSDAKVNWFFLDGAFVLQSVHKRDHAQLEKGEDKSLQKALLLSYFLLL